MTPQFIHVLLCDNDFAQPLEEASARVFASFGTRETEEDFRKCVVGVASALNDLRAVQNGSRQSAYEYLNGKVRVVFSNEQPIVDHDGGSVAIDCNTAFVWRF